MASRNLLCAVFAAGRSHLASPGGVSLHSLPGFRFLSYNSRRVVLGAHKTVWSCFDTFDQPSSSPYLSKRWKSIRLADGKVSWGLGAAGIKELEDFSPLDDPSLQQGVTQQINTSLEQGEAGRLFAVVYIRGIQHKVTPGDVIVVKYDFPPKAGDKIRLEKVLAVGGKDFSLIGQPLLGRDVVRVDATVIEKTLSHNRVWFVYQKRRSFKQFHLYREFFTMLVINNIQVAKLSEDHTSSDDDQKRQIDQE